MQICRKKPSPRKTLDLSKTHIKLAIHTPSQKRGGTTNFRAEKGTPHGQGKLQYRQRQKERVLGMKKLQERKLSLLREKEKRK